MDAKVTIRSVPIDDEGGYIDDEDTPEVAMDEFQAQSDFRLKDNKLRLGVASDKSTVSSVFVQTALPELQLVVDWVASKIGGKPRLPSPYLNDSNYVYLDGTLKLSEVNPDSDGTAQKVTITGQYIYGVKQRNGAALRPAKPPWADPLIAKDMSLVASDFINGILDDFVDGKGQVNPAFGNIKGT